MARTSSVSVGYRLTLMDSLRKRRIVLLPQGQPAREDQRVRCAALYLKLGGDLERVIDGPCSDIDRFCSYVQRIPVLREGSEHPLILLTQTTPFASRVVQTRVKLHRAVPALDSATWILFVDCVVDPFFVRTASAMGSFQYDQTGALEWIADNGDAFLVANADGGLIEVGLPPPPRRPESDPMPFDARVTMRGFPSLDPPRGK